jgi:glycosyltransferase involved in cell wall biosynthesis
MITYGHEKFIEEAIYGVLNQECDFDVELVIANDCSPDGSDVIIKKIIQNHSRGKWIKYIKNSVNLGMMSNFSMALHECSGKYIAICEGDDYWTNPNKLQKQVSFLEANPEYVLSFHNAEIINTIYNKKHLFVDSYSKAEYNVDDVFKSWLMPTASMVFRNCFEDNLPEFLVQGTHGDLALQVYLFEFGKFFAHNEIMSVYRINETSVTISNFSSLQHNNRHIRQLELMNIFFDGRYSIQIGKRIFLYYLRNANTFRRRHIIKPIYWIFKAVFFQPKFMFCYKSQFFYSIRTVLFTARIFLKLKKNVS